MTLPAVGGDDDLVRDLARRHGMSPRTVTHLGGVVNRVYRVTGQGADWVVRLPVDPQDDVFGVEAWAIAAARRAGIATPEVVATGVDEGVPFMISAYVPAAAEEVDGPWSWLGAYARRVAEIDLAGAPAGLWSRFGSDLEAAWLAHVEYNLAALQDDDLAGRAYRPQDAAPIRRAVEALGARSFSFGLAHGDLAPRNILSRGRAVAPVLIDWGNVKTGPAPWTDAQQVYQWAVCDRTIPRGDYEELARAAGVADDEVTIARLTVLQLVDVTRWAAERRPDLLGRYLRECRDGLARVLPRALGGELSVIES